LHKRYETIERELSRTKFSIISCNEKQLHAR
jgi:hypothetical protein